MEICKLAWESWNIYFSNKVKTQAEKVNTQAEKGGI